MVIVNIQRKPCRSLDRKLLAFHTPSSECIPALSRHLSPVDVVILCGHPSVMIVSFPGMSTLTPPLSCHTADVKVYRAKHIKRRRTLCKWRAKNVGFQFRTFRIFFSYTSTQRPEKVANQINLFLEDLNALCCTNSYNCTSAYDYESGVRYVVSYLYSSLQLPYTRCMYVATT